MSVTRPTARARVGWRPGLTARRQRTWPWFVPIIAMMVLVFAYPVIEIVRLSFTDAMLGSSEANYTLESYERMFNDPAFATSLRVTFTFAITSVVFQVLCGFAIALLLYEASRLRIRGTVIVRTIVLSAWAIPGVVVGIVWTLIYQESAAGILNHLLSPIFGVDNIPFLSDPNLALVSAIVASVWRGTAMSMIFCYAGLQTIPHELREAAAVDGASWWRHLRSVVIPLLIPILAVNVITVTVETFNTFDMMMVLTGGGPGYMTEVLALRVYNAIFDQFRMGQGAATAVVLLIIDALIIAVFLWLTNRSRRANADTN